MYFCEIAWWQYIKIFACKGGNTSYDILYYVCRVSGFHHRIRISFWITKKELLQYFLFQCKYFVSSKEQKNCLQHVNKKQQAKSQYNVNGRSVVAVWSGWPNLKHWISIKIYTATSATHAANQKFSAVQKLFSTLKLDLFYWRWFIIIKSTRDPRLTNRIQDDVKFK